MLIFSSIAIVLYPGFVLAVYSCGIIAVTVRHSVAIYMGRGEGR